MSNKGNNLRGIQVVFIRSDTPGSASMDVLMASQLKKMGAEVFVLGNEEWQRPLSVFGMENDGYLAGKFNEVSEAHPVYAAKDWQIFAVVQAANEVLGKTIPPVMEVLISLVDQGRLDPSRAVVIGNGGTLKFYGALFAHLGFERVVVIEPYLFQNFNNVWPDGLNTQILMHNSIASTMANMMFVRPGLKFAEAALTKVRGGKHKITATTDKIEQSMFQALIISPLLLRHLSSAVSPTPYIDWEKRFGILCYPTPLLADNPIPERMQRFLSDGKAFVFSPGSMNISKADQRWLTSVVVQAAKSEGFKVLALGTSGADSESVMYYNDGYIPHEAVFPHAAGVVSHMGSGTSQLILWSGKPALAIPFLKQSDQPHWARAAVEMGWGIGNVPFRKLLDAKDAHKDDQAVQLVRQSFNNLVNRPEISHRASELGQQQRRLNQDYNPYQMIAELVWASFEGR